MHQRNEILMNSYPRCMLRSRRDDKTTKYAKQSVTSKSRRATSKTFFKLNIVQRAKFQFAQFIQCGFKIGLAIQKYVGWSMNEQISTTKANFKLIPFAKDSGHVEISRRINPGLPFKHGGFIFLCLVWLQKILHFFKIFVAIIGGGRELRKLF